MHSSSVINTNQKLSDIQLSQILAHLAQNPIEDPFKCFQDRAYFRNKHATNARSALLTRRFCLSPKLASWSSSAKSGLVVVHGSYSSRFVLQDFCVDVIKQLQEADVPTIWALCGVIKACDKASSGFSIVDVLKYLTFQAVRLNQHARSEKEISWRCSQFQVASMPGEWMAIFLQSVQGVGNQVYVAIDLAMLSHVYQSEGFNFLLELNRSVQQSKVQLKILLISYQTSVSQEFYRICPGSLVPVKIAGGASKPGPRGRPSAPRLFRGSRQLR